MPRRPMLVPCFGHKRSVETAMTTNTPLCWCANAAPSVFPRYEELCISLKLKFGSSFWAIQYVFVAIAKENYLANTFLGQSR